MPVGFCPACSLRLPSSLEVWRTTNLWHRWRTTGRFEAEKGSSRQRPTSTGQDPRLKRVAPERISRKKLFVMCKWTRYKVLLMLSIRWCLVEGKIQILRAPWHLTCQGHMLTVNTKNENKGLCFLHAEIRRTSTIHNHMCLKLRDVRNIN
jgi:hypothetical protein